MDVTARLTYVPRDLHVITVTITDRAGAVPIWTIGRDLLLGGLIGVSYGLIGGPVGGWARPSPLTSVIAGVLLLAAFIAWERRVRMPMLPLGLFGSAQDARAIRLPSSRSRPMVQIGTAPARSVIVTVMT